MQQRHSEEPSAHDVKALPTDLLNLHEIVAKARQNLNQNDWDYIVGGAESETTLRRNRMALDISRSGRGCCATSATSMSRCATSGAAPAPGRARPRRIAGKLPSAGALSVVRATGEVRCCPYAQLGLRSRARGRRRSGTRGAASLSALCSRRRGLGRRYVSRAIAHGYAAFCLTVDTAHYSRRERDLAKRYVTARPGPRAKPRDSRPGSTGAQ